MATKTSTPKTLVIGSMGHAHVTCARWEDITKVNVVDFDVVVVNCHVLTEKYLQTLKWDFFDHLRTQLTRLLVSGGTIIALGIRKHRARITDHTSLNTYSWSPIDIGTQIEAGDTVKRDTGDFPKLLSNLKRWEYWYFVPNSCLSHELTNICGSTTSFKYRNTFAPFASNRYGRVLAGSIRFTITAKEERDREPLTLGPLVVLPAINDFGYRESINHVLEDLLNLPQEDLPPAWIDQIVVPGVSAIEAAIAAKQTSISDLQAEIAALSEQKRALDYYKQLLYMSGTALERVFATCLEKLGGTIRPAKYSEEEFVLEYKGATYLVECKGVSKSIALSHVRQLTDYMLKYEEDEGVAGKGILFGNAWKDLPVEDRDKADTPHFPTNVVARSRTLDIALVSAPAFFEAFSHFLEGRLSGDAILERLTKTAGVCHLL